MSVSIIRGNALNLPLKDNSVDLVVTSPPYFGLRSYQDGGEQYAGQIGAEATPGEFVDALIAATREMMRVVKPTGSIFVNLGDKYAGAGRGNNRSSRLNNTDEMMQARLRSSNRRQHLGKDMAPAQSLMGLPWRYALRCIDELRLILRGEIIWSKPNGMPDNPKDRVRRNHEHWFHLVSSTGYYANLDAIRETNGSLPRSVWTVATQPLRVPAELGVDHFAAFPMEWPRRIIQGWSPPGGTVLDPFGGTGTTALVADVLGRKGISVDLSADYCRLAKWRTQDPKERARALKTEPQKRGNLAPSFPVAAPGEDVALF